MRRADRLFDIIQVLRLARTPITAAAIAAELEVAPRTVYRDIATLQARYVPIEGAAGLGYVLRRGFELPPLMFTEDEIEAVTVGLRLLRRTGDPGLEAAARSVLNKLAAVMPDALRERLEAAPFHVAAGGAPTPGAVSLSDIRAAIRVGGIHGDLNIVDEIILVGGERNGAREDDAIERRQVLACSIENAAWQG